MTYAEFLVWVMYICGYLVIGLGGLTLTLIILFPIVFVINKIYKYMQVSHLFIEFIRKRKRFEQYLKDNK